MASYEERLQEHLGPRPRRPANLNLFGFEFGAEGMEDYRSKRDAYNQAAHKLVETWATQDASPTKGMSLGQVSELSGFSPQQLADPAQYRDRAVTEPSQVPSFRYVQTMSDTPLVSRQQLEGPPKPVTEEQYGPGQATLRPGMESRFEERIRQQNSFQKGLGRPDPDKAESLYPTADLMQEGPRPSTTRYEQQPTELVSEPSTGPSIRPGTGMNRFASLVGTPFAAGAASSPQPMSGMPGSQPLSLDDPRGSMSGSVRTPEIGAAGRFDQVPSQPINYSVREVDTGAPASLWQQGIAASNIKREAVWPRNYGYSGSGGANTLAAKAQMNFDGYMAMHPEADPVQVMGWAKLAAATGEPMPDTKKATNLDARTRASQSRGALDDVRADEAPQRRKEIERHNKMMEQLRRQQLDLQKSHQERMQKAQDNKDWVAVERLNEQRYWHDQLMLAFGAIDKPDMFTDEQQEAFAQGMGIIGQLGDRPATETELGFLEKLTGNQRPRYKYEPRKPLPSGAPNSMQRQPKKESAASIPTVNSQEEYDRLPKGARYKDSQGNEATKK